MVPDLGQGPRASSAQSSTPRSQTSKIRATNAPYGAIDTLQLADALDFMTTLGLVPNAVTVDQLVNESLLPVTPAASVTF